MKLKSALVPADKYPVIRRKKEIWKLKLDELNSEDVSISFPLSLSLSLSLVISKAFLICLRFFYMFFRSINVVFVLNLTMATTRHFFRKLVRVSLGKLKPHVCVIFLLD